MTKFLSLLFVKIPLAVADMAAKLRVVTEPLALVILLLLGVHGATDILDDLLFTAVDYLDRGLDGTVRALLSWLGSYEIFKPENAAQWADDFALLVDIDRKEVASVILALVVELLLDAALLIWCLPSKKLEQPQEELETAPSTARFKRSIIIGWQRGPGWLRGMTLVLAFVLGAFAIGRWVTGKAALFLAGPLFGPGAPSLAPLFGLALAVIALLTVMPLALQRAAERSRSQASGRFIRSRLFPALAGCLLLGAIITGAPGRTVARFFEPAELPTTLPASMPESQATSAPAEKPDSNKATGKKKPGPKKKKTKKAKLPAKGTPVEQEGKPAKEQPAEEEPKAEKPAAEKPAEQPPVDKGGTP